MPHGSIPGKVFIVLIIGGSQERYQKGRRVVIRDMERYHLGSQAVASCKWLVRASFPNSLYENS